MKTFLARALLFASFTVFISPVFAAADLKFCTPTETKTCIYLDDEIITIKSIQSGVASQIIYNLNNCFEDYRGGRKCDASILTVASDNIQIIDRNNNELTFGKDEVYVNLRARNERVILNGQSVPEFYHINVGQGRVGTTDTRFSLSKEDGLLAFASDMDRRTGVEYFQYSAAPKNDNHTVVKRFNLLHKISLQYDALNNPTQQLLSINTGSVLLKIIHTTPATLSLSNVNDGKGVSAGTSGGSSSGTNPTPNPNLGTFEIDVDGQKFNVRSTVPAVLTQLRAILAGTSSTNINNAHIEGEIVAGTQTYNTAWGFSLNPTTVAVFVGSDYSCDGVPSVINRHLSDVGRVDFFFDKTWCPNSARLIREIF